MSSEEDVTLPVSLIDVVIPLAALPTDRQWGGLDRGCSMTKILYITNEEFENPKHEVKRVLKCALFVNKNFEKGIEWFKKEAYLPRERGPLHVTGAGGANFQKWIGEQLNVDVEFQDEFLSQIRGAHFMLKYLEYEEMCFPAPSDVADLSHYKKPEILTKVQETIRNKLKEGNQEKELDPDTGKPSRLPAIFVFMGSGGGITRVNADASGKISGGVTFAGKTFLGLGKALLGTANYDEICSLAEQGARQNTDTPIEEVFDDGELPESTPFVCFGKLATSGKTLKDFDRADLARAHVAATAMNIVTAITLACANEKIADVYVGGNLVRAEIIRKEIHVAKGLYSPEEIKFHYLKTGHTGAIGAMMTCQSDQTRFFEAMKGSQS